ncbi:MAG: 2-C-methyl-D-erythritol 4-phosphate cytidylyltransferase [Gammaproteobacteria bacterium]
MTAWAVVPAAGAGRRFGAGRPKQYLSLAGRPVLSRALAPLLAEPRIKGLVLVVAEGDDAWRDAVGEDHRVETVIGGAERCHSVLAGLDALAGRAAGEDWVFVHDAARPCLTEAEVAALFRALAGEASGALLAVPLADTLKRADDEGRARATVPRDGLWRALTPQVFRYGALRAALAAAIAEGELVTDEAAAMERAGHRPRLVPGASGNIKITGPADLDLAAAVLTARQE